MTQLYRPKSTVTTTASASDRQLFFWGWMRWGALTAGERFVCAFIILIPVLWVMGIYKYMTSLLLVCIAVYEWWKHGEIRLKPPITAVVAVFIFCIYRIAQMLINYDAPNKGSISGLLMTWFSYALLLWYIQSNNVRLRLEAIAWACTVSIVQMLGFWLLLQYVLPIGLFQPPSIPNLFGLVTGKAAGENLLAPYQGDISGYYRPSLFFVSAQLFALIVGCIGLIALEIKNRIWSLLVLLGSVFLIVISLSRGIWIAFPIAVWFRYLFSAYSQPRNRLILFAVMAVASFTVLSIAPFTHFLVSSYTDITAHVSQFRASSTEWRAEIYRQTWEAFLEQPIWGQIGKGQPVSMAGGEANVVGSHSVILGNLLYGNGIVGTGIFAVFWISLFAWLYKTRSGRPLTVFCVMIMFTLAAATLGAMWFSPFPALALLLCIAIRQPKLKPAGEVRSWLSS
ncbi:O-antigen ligase family protein [Scytonema millei]|uniref:O-antigen ligase family protein n=1 Tax=Scytonema millei VB511283 TaxID=1245923 RepID=A0A9X5E2L4_9CYAN|nr:O-antigen ligase family protein [Scytonema millei]NHC33907.1 O-antigen ligase family protein [Scytonema millei VB511283]